MPKLPEHLYYFLFLIFFMILIVFLRSYFFFVPIAFLDLLCEFLLGTL